MPSFISCDFSDSASLLSFSPSTVQSSPSVSWSVSQLVDHKVSKSVSQSLLQRVSLSSVSLSVRESVYLPPITQDSLFVQSNSRPVSQVLGQYSQVSIREQQIITSIKAHLACSMRLCCRASVIAISASNARPFRLFLLTGY